MQNNILKLHLGCGKVYIDGWVNIDLDSDVADLNHDLRNPLPYENESVDYIFAEHFIEHLTQSEAKIFLTECHRVLKNDGVIRLTTPNLFILLTNYIKGDLNEWGEYWAPPTKAHMINEGMRSWGHHFLYDSEEIARFLIECNFDNIKFERWRESEISHFSNIENRNNHKEIIVEAYKNVNSSDESFVDYTNIKSLELEWVRTLNDKNLERIKELETYICALTSYINGNERKQKNYERDLLTHINNQEKFIFDLKKHILNLEKTNISNKGGKC